MNETASRLPGPALVGNREPCARSDGGRLSPDGGVPVRREIEGQPGLRRAWPAAASVATDRAAAVALADGAVRDAAPAFLGIAARIAELESRIGTALPSAYSCRKALVATTGRFAARGP